jgi:hypothetical protein
MVESVGKIFEREAYLNNPLGENRNQIYVFPSLLPIISPLCRLKLLILTLICRANSVSSDNLDNSFSYNNPLR